MRDRRAFISGITLGVRTAALAAQRKRDRAAVEKLSAAKKTVRIDVLYLARQQHLPGQLR
jgi:hypothetical protein